MQDSNMNTTRLDDLLNTISEAKKSLTNWQDKRTEALIRLDAFTYDIKMLEEDKKKTSNQIVDLKKELQNHAKVYQSHVSDLTDQLQLLKYENETLKNEVLDKSLTIEAMQKEVESQKSIRDQLVQVHQEKQAEIRADMELRAQNQTWEFRVRNEDLASRVSDIAKQKIEVELKAERLEKEMAQMRAHMMNMLDVKNFGELESKPAAPQADAKKALKPAVNTDFSMQEVKKLRAVEFEPESVEEYLKKLGY